MRIIYFLSIWLLCLHIYGATGGPTINKIKHKVRTFPVNFKWGFATSAYQIEGAWNIDGKGDNIWDTFTHKLNSPVVDNSNGDVSCDSYHKYAEDVQLLKTTGADFYRFSLSWSRLLPNGTLAVINQLGIDYYNRLIDELVANGIEPMVTLYHWDLPEDLMAIGGWPNEELITHFSEYARLAFASFGDRVKKWITFNEPSIVCLEGFGSGTHAPGRRKPAEDPYLCAHTVLKSHAMAYRIYEGEFKVIQQGRVGITIDTSWFEPGSDALRDIEAAERALQFRHGWFASPIFFGKYPDVMREYIDKNSKRLGSATSRLPEFDANWTLLIRGSWDFLGLNHYTTNLVKHIPQIDILGWRFDQQTLKYFDRSWEKSASIWLRVVPWGFRSLLNWIKNTYGNPEIFVTENGFSTEPEESLNDTRRINYYQTYLENLHAAIEEDGCNVTAYTAWTLLDNFEWTMGYTERFGVHAVDFSNPERPRTPKASATFLTQIFTHNSLPLSQPLKSCPYI